MINLCIQEIAKIKDLSLEELSQHSNVSVQDIQSYETIETLTDEIAANLRKIASNLNVSVVELVKPVVKQGAFRFKIFEMVQKQGLTIEQLSKNSGVHLAIVAFYSTQPIDEHKFNELEFNNKYLTKISEVIGCSTEELKVETNLPITKVDLKEWSEKRGLNLEDISVLTGIPIDFVDLISTQYIDEPLDISLRDHISDGFGFLRLMPENSVIASLQPETTPKELFCYWIEKITGEKISVCK